MLVNKAILKVWGRCGGTRPYSSGREFETVSVSNTLSSRPVRGSYRFRLNEKNGKVHFSLHFQV